jgi:hypothetical protein
MNNSRGEVTIQLAGEERVMRPTFEAMCAIERDLNTNILPLMDRILNKADFGVLTAATIIHHGLKGAGDTRLTLAEVGADVVKQGTTNVFGAVIELLASALHGVDSLGKRKEAAENRLTVN